MRDGQAGSGGCPSHSLVVFSSECQHRERVGAWVADALRRGDKVLYEHRSSVGPVARRLGWLAGSGVDLHAVPAGQLEVVDAGQLHAETGGERGALYQRHVDRVQQARRDGYPGVAVTADGAAMHEMAPEESELLAHERGVHRLSAEFPVRALCRYDSGRERPELLRKLLEVHYNNVQDAMWGAVLREGRLRVHGEVDISNVERFSTVLHAAARAGVPAVDLAGLRFLGVAGMAALARVAEAQHARGRRLVVANAVGVAARVFSVLGFADYPGVELTEGETSP